MKQLISGLEEEMHKVNLEHSVVPKARKIAKGLIKSPPGPI